MFTNKNAACCNADAGDAGKLAFLSVFKCLCHTVLDLTLYNVKLSKENKSSFYTSAIF